MKTVNLNLEISMIMKVCLPLIVVIMLLVSTQQALSNESPRWDDLWISGGLGVGPTSLNADYGQYLNLSSSGTRGFLDVKIGRAFSRKIGGFMHGVMAGTDSDGVTANLMWRPTTASSFFVFGGIGYYNPGSIQGVISAGAGFDIWRFSIDGRGFYGANENTTASGLILTLNFFWGRSNPFDF